MTICNSGRLVSVDNDNVPTIADIARGLSRQIRFGGHSDIPYTVMQHTFVVAAHVPAHLRAFALLHDASEAIMGDTPRPWKITEVKELEAGLLTRICTYYGLPEVWPEEAIKAVYDIDFMAACAEAIVLFGEAAREWCSPWVEPSEQMLTDVRNMLPMGPIWIAQPDIPRRSLHRLLVDGINAWREHLLGQQ